MADATALTVVSTIAERNMRQLDPILGTVPDKVEVPLVDAEGEFPDLLTGSVTGLQNALSNLGGTPRATTLGTLQLNAFMSSVAQARELAVRTRIKKWAGQLATTMQDSFQGGLLHVQLGAIGVTVEEDAADMPTT